MGFSEIFEDSQCSLRVVPIFCRVWSQSSQVRALRSSEACIPRVLCFRTSQKTDWGRTHKYIKEDKHKNVYEKVKASDFMQNYRSKIKFQNPIRFLWI